LLQLGAQLSVNEWNRKFFDALESRNVESLGWATALLPVLVVFSGFAVSGALVARMTLQMRWREWLTEKLAGWWLEDQRYYRLEIAAAEQTSPEYRIAKDVQLAVDPLVEFAVGLLTALATASTFVGVLWTVGGALELNLFGLRPFCPAILASRRWPMRQLPASSLISPAGRWFRPSQKRTRLKRSSSQN
jgi:putative ATP-binding cassette transporter